MQHDNIYISNVMTTNQHLPFVIATHTVKASHKIKLYIFLHFLKI